MTRWYDEEISVTLSNKEWSFISDALNEERGRHFRLAKRSTYASLKRYEHESAIKLIDVISEKILRRGN